MRTFELVLTALKITLRVKTWFKGSGRNLVRVRCLVMKVKVRVILKVRVLPKVE